MMHAVAIQEDDWSEDTGRTEVGLSEADERALRNTLAVLADPQTCHPAAALAALLNHLARQPDAAALLPYATEWLRRIAKDGVRAAVVDLGLEMP